MALQLDLELNLLLVLGKRKMDLLYLDIQLIPPLRVPQSMNSIEASPVVFSIPLSNMSNPQNELCVINSSVNLYFVFSKILCNKLNNVSY